MEKKKIRFDQKGQKGMTRREFIETSAKVVGGLALSSGGIWVSHRRAFAAKKINMRMSVSVKRGHPAVEGCFHFADVVRQKTNGELDIKVYAGASLGGYDISGTEGCINRQWEFATCTSTNLSNFTNIFRATELPYLYTTLEDSYKVDDGEPWEIFSMGVEKFGLKLLVPFHFGFRNYYNNVREVHSPADMKGQKVRTSFSTIEIATIKALGGNPMPITWAEVITSLAQGIVDGTGQSDDLVYTSKQYEVLKYCTQIKYMDSIFCLLMNKKAYEELPKDFQTVLVEASRSSLELHRRLAVDAVQKAWVAMKKKGIKKYIPSSDELNLFIKAAKPVWDKHVRPGEAEPELVDIILKRTGRTKKDLFG